MTLYDTLWPYLWPYITLSVTLYDPISDPICDPTWPYLWPYMTPAKCRVVNALRKWPQPRVYDANEKNPNLSMGVTEAASRKGWYGMDCRFCFTSTLQHAFQRFWSKGLVGYFKFWTWLSPPLRCRLATCYNDELVQVWRLLQYVQTGSPQNYTKTRLQMEGTALAIIANSPPFSDLTDQLVCEIFPCLQFIYKTHLAPNS